MSLHINAYENKFEDKYLKKRNLSSFKNEWINKHFNNPTTTHFIEIFRQQRNEDNFKKPEIMQYRASQKLFNSTQSMLPTRNEDRNYPRRHEPYPRFNNHPTNPARMSVPNIPRIGFRPNIYARPQMRHQAPPPIPRPPVPTSRNRMLKPGFETSSTVYTRPVTHRSPDKSPDPPPKNLEPYHVLSNFIYTEEELRNTPSFKSHNIPFEEELALRRSGTFFIKELCRRLNAPFADKRSKITPRAMCVAMIYLHRFYMFHSVATFDPMQIGTACLFLAAKCEECPRKLSHFSKQLYSMLHPDDLNLLENDELEPMNDLITALETAVLQTVAFELNIELPHVDIIQVNFPSPGDRLRKMAYHLTTDLLTTTTLCIQYNSRAIAAACFFVAASYLDIDMEKEFGEKWYVTIEKSLTEDVLVKIVKSFINGLEECKYIIKAERLPRPSDSFRNESSKSQLIIPETPPTDKNKLNSNHSADDKSHDRSIPQEERSNRSSENHSHEKIPSKDNRISDGGAKHTLPPKDPYDISGEPKVKAPYEQSQEQHIRRKAPYDTSREHGRRTLDAHDRLKAPYERVETSQHKERKTPEIVHNDRSKRTPEISSKQDRQRDNERQKVSQHRTSDISHHKPPHEQQQSRQSSEKHHASTISSFDRNKPSLEKTNNGRLKEIEAPYRQRSPNLQVPLLVPPPLPPPSFEIRKRKTPMEDEVAQKRTADSSRSSLPKQSYEPINFSLPPPPLPPPHDRRQSLPSRDLTDSSNHRNVPTRIPINSNFQQPPYHNDQRRDNDARPPYHQRSEHNRHSNPNLTQTSNNSSHFQQRDNRKRDMMMQNFIPAQQNQSSSIPNRHKIKKFDDLEEGEIE